MAITATLAKPKRKKIKDDGVPYENMGESYKDLFADVGGFRERAMWFPASSFSVVLLRQIVEKLMAVSGEDGTEFLRNLGIDSVEDLKDLSGVTVFEMTAQALASLPRGLLIRLGLEEPL